MIIKKKLSKKFQHTAARRRLDFPRIPLPSDAAVSTHSRPKAAGTSYTRFCFFCNCFNTQPPEGGWVLKAEKSRFIKVSTHSRPKAAGPDIGELADLLDCFNTQPPEGGWALGCTAKRLNRVSTHSRPKAAGFASCGQIPPTYLFQHTAARRRLAAPSRFPLSNKQFQHTAARRRLAVREEKERVRYVVSTHSRPKAAGLFTCKPIKAKRFQHTAARRRLARNLRFGAMSKLFQHTAARRRLVCVVNRAGVDSFVSTHSRPKAAGSAPSGKPFTVTVSTHSRPKAAGL